MYNPETGDHPNRKSDASFYTLPSTAALLSALAIHDQNPEANPRGRTARICDPACGSGILLESAAIRAKELGAARIELYGADINPEAIEAARRRLEGKCDHLDLRIMPMGPQPDGNVKCGSLELIIQDDWPWPAQLKQDAQARLDMYYGGVEQ